jgi:hypothetical protein
VDDASIDRFKESGVVEPLRMAGQVLSAARHLYDVFRPVAGDPVGVALGKAAVRYGSVVTVGGVGVVACGTAAVVCL